MSDASVAYQATMRCWHGPQLAPWSVLVLLPLLASPTGSSRSCSYSPDTAALNCTVPHLPARAGPDSAAGGQSSSVLEFYTGSGAAAAGSVLVTCSAVGPSGVLAAGSFSLAAQAQHLEVVDCDLTEVGPYAFSGLQSLRSLRIRSNECSADGNTAGSWRSGVTVDRGASGWRSGVTVHKNAFSNLHGLHTLQLSVCGLYSLTEGSLCSLYKLTSLNLSHNHLQAVSDAGIQSQERLGQPCLTSVRNLDLSHNKISSLPGHSLSNLINLETLNLSSNGLSSLSDHALNNLFSLRVLRLSHNKLVALPSGLFSSSDGLRELYLQDNLLSVLQPGLLTGLSHLQVLNISHNNLTSTGLSYSPVLSGLLRLVALDLSHNQIQSLERITFRNLTSLQILNLANNRLRTLPGMASSDLQLPNLHLLVLSNNLIADLPVDCLNGLSVLSSLSFDHNQMRDIPRGLFANTSSLQDLRMSHNMLSNIPEELTSLRRSIRTIDLSNNRIQSLDMDGEAVIMENLFGLNLASNRLTSLTRPFFDRIPEAEILNLGDNSISTIEQDTFISLTKLSALRLDRNQIFDINGLLTAQSRLRWLNVSSNSLQWFDYAFIPKQLEWINIEQNNIEEIGNYYSLRDGFSLRTLEAANNNIRKLTASSFLSGLRRVYLNSNQITEIAPNTFTHLENISLVDLSYNQLRTFPLSSLLLSQKKKESASFYLGFNPVLCDCETEFLVKLDDLAQTGPYPTIKDKDKLTCTLNTLAKSTNGSKDEVTPSYRESLLESTPESAFLCPYTAHCFPVCQCCDYFACDCRMQCPDGCFCFHDSTWNHNVIDCSYRSHSDVPPLIPMDATVIHLDGNHFRHLESSAFIGRKRVRTLFLNNSGIQTIGDRTLDGLVELEILHLENNRLAEISGDPFSNLTKLRELYLENNKLTHINPESIMKLVSLQVLFLHSNLLTQLSVWSLSSLPNLSVITLSNNSWTCHCSFVRELQDLSRQVLVRDSSQLECVDESNSVTDQNDGGSSRRIGLGPGTNISCVNSLAIANSPPSGGHHDAGTAGRMGSEDEASVDPGILPLALGVSAAVILALSAFCLLVFLYREPLKRRWTDRCQFHGHHGRRTVVAGPHDGSPVLQCDDILVGTGSSGSQYGSSSTSTTRNTTSDQSSGSPQANLGPGLKSANGKMVNGVGGDQQHALPVVGGHHPQIHGVMNPMEVFATAGGPHQHQYLTGNSGMESSRQPQRIWYPSSPGRQNNGGGGSEAWSDISDSGYGFAHDHLYQTIDNHQSQINDQQDPVYHTLEPEQQGVNPNTIEVMLPNGQMVPATLVRNRTGRVIPLIQVPNDYSESPSSQGGRLTGAATAGRTTKYKTSGRPDNHPQLPSSSTSATSQRYNNTPARTDNQSAALRYNNNNGGGGRADNQPGHRYNSPGGRTDSDRLKPYQL